MRNALERFFDDSENKEIARIVIIGGGAAGLSALGALQRRRNCEVILLEKEAHVGGVWYLCDYPGLSIHARSFSFKFYNFRSPLSITQHATRNEILSYLDSYVAHFDLGSQIALQRRAVKVTYHEADDVVHKCHVEVEHVQSRDRVVLRCDYVICATGFTNAGTPHVPEFKTDGVSFKGEVLHSSQLDAALLAKMKMVNADVCLLGAGKSAYDIALQLTGHGLCEKTTWVYRKFLWGLNYDFIYSSRPDKLTLMKKHSKYQYLRRRVADSRSLDSLAEEVVAGGFVLNIENNLNLYETRSAIYKPREISELRSKTRRIKSSIQSLGERCLKLENGREVNADYIICCTGYSRAKSLPEMVFHSKDRVGTPIDPTEQPLLYRGMIDLRIPRVILFTGEVLFTAQLFGFSIAAEWVCEYLADFGRSTFADLDLKKKQVVADAAAINANIKPGYEYSWVPRGMPNYGYFSGEASYRYLTQILADLGISEKAVAYLYSAAENERDFEGVTNFFRRRLARRLDEGSRSARAVGLFEFAE